MHNDEHKSVMADELIAGLQIDRGNWYLDGTLGRGGHASRMLEAGAKVIAFDWDEEAIKFNQHKFSSELKTGDLILVRESFSKIGTIVNDLQKRGVAGEIAGIAFDFGTSTNQLMSSERGFSFEGDGPLDMRMDQRLGVRAADILHAVPTKQLAEMFYQYGGEQKAKQIADAIKRSKKPITTVIQLIDLIEKVKGGRRGKLHPATQVFQALRIAVNSELAEIELALPQALELLVSGGRLVTIAFHEGEDRIVKLAFKKWASEGKGRALGLFKPQPEEIETNPRSRSAKLRIFEKV